MDCKKAILLSLILITSVCGINKCYGQNCSIYKTPYKAFGFDSSGLVSEKYNNIHRKDSGLYQIYFVSTFGKKAEAYYLSIDTFKNLQLCYLTESLVKSIDNKSSLNIYEVLKGDDTLNGYFLSTCKNVLSWSYNQTLVISNPKGKWIEYTSIDGHMNDALKENGEYQYLLKVLNLLQKIFPEFKVAL